MAILGWSCDDRTADRASSGRDLTGTAHSVLKGMLRHLYCRAGDHPPQGNVDLQGFPHVSSQATIRRGQTTVTNSTRNSLVPVSRLELELGALPFPQQVLPEFPLLSNSTGQHPEGNSDHI